MSPHMLPIRVVGCVCVLLLVPCVTAIPASDSVCNVDSDCGSVMLDCISGICTHKGLLPFTYIDVIGAIISVLGSAFSNAGGIGGGGIMVPVLILLYAFSPHDAIPLSKVTVFSGAVVRFWLTYKVRHPDADKAVTDYDTAMVLEPLVLAGTMIGVVLNRMLPGWIILFLLTVVLLITTWTTVRKSLELWAKETASHELSAALYNDKPNSTGNKAPQFIELTETGTDATAFDIPTVPIQLTLSQNRAKQMQQSIDTYQPPRSAAERSVSQADPEHDSQPLTRMSSEEVERALEDIRRREARVVQWDKIGFIFVSYAAVVLASLSRGGHGALSPFGVEPCGAVYWLITVAFFVFSCVYTWYLVRKVIREHELKVRVRYVFTKGDVIWTFKSAIRYSLLGVVAGIAAGMLGIGGGMILGPMLLEMGMVPQVSAATSSYMVLFTSSSTTFQFLVLGMLRPDYAPLMLAFAFFGAVLGVKTTDTLVAKFRRSSIIVVALAVVIGISAILIPSFGLVNTIADYRAGVDIFAFNSVC
eukprot:GILK01008486.1.p1 GENE.GILK01008486.1~~GILK01008486.1.p1  ORF type:complete len:545 (-),score=85.29 GILK01008486.1:211-1803(-)